MEPLPALHSRSLDPASPFLSSPLLSSPFLSPFIHSFILPSLSLAFPRIPFFISHSSLVLIQPHTMADLPSDSSSPQKSTLIVVNGADDRDAGIYSDGFYSQRMSPLRSAIRRRMLPWVRSETQCLADLQVRATCINLSIVLSVSSNWSPSIGAGEKVTSAENSCSSTPDHTPTPHHTTLSHGPGRLYSSPLFFSLYLHLSLRMS